MAGGQQGHVHGAAAAATPAPPSSPSSSTTPSSSPEKLKRPPPRPLAPPRGVTEAANGLISPAFVGDVDDDPMQALVLRSNSS